MKWIIFLFLVFLVFPVAHARAEGRRLEKTVIKDQKEAGLLLGRHVFTDHQIFENDVFFQRTLPGMAGITQEEIWGSEEKAPYLLSAHHKVLLAPACDPGSGFASGEIFLIGRITEIRPQEFDFEGTISGLITNYNQIQKTGTFTFLRKKHPAYWALQGVEDDSYPWDCWRNIDIYLTDDAGTLFDREKALRQMHEKCKDKGR